MRRLVGEHFNPRGRPKKAFGSQGDAWEYKIRRRMRQHQPYRCGICGAWHLGSKR